MTTNQQAAEFLRRVHKGKEKFPQHDLFSAIGGELADAPRAEVTRLVWDALEKAGGRSLLDWEWVATLTHTEVLGLIDSAIKELEGGG